MVIHAASTSNLKNDYKQTSTAVQQSLLKAEIKKIDPFSMPILGRKPSGDKNPSTISFDIEDEFAALPKEKSVGNSSLIKSVQVSDENYDDSYVCTDCQPSKFLRNSNSLFEHCKQMIDHGNINPICFYNKFSLKVKKIELTTYRKNDSSELNRLVRNTMAVNFKSEEHPNLRNNLFEVPNKKIKAELL